jgi:hypothetical protein
VLLSVARCVSLGGQTLGVLDKCCLPQNVPSFFFLKTQYLCLIKILARLYQALCVAIHKIKLFGQTHGINSTL